MKIQIDLIHYIEINRKKIRREDVEAQAYAAIGNPKSKMADITIVTEQSKLRFVLSTTMHKAKCPSVPI